MTAWAWDIRQTVGGNAIAIRHIVADGDLSACGHAIFLATDLWGNPLSISQQATCDACTVIERRKAADVPVGCS